MTKFASPSRGASLLLSFRLQTRAVIIVGSGRLAANRAFSCLEADARVVLLSHGGPENACEELRWRIEQGEIEWRSIEGEAKLWQTSASNSGRGTTAGEDEDEDALHSVLSSLPSVSFVCITDTMIPPSSTPSSQERRSAASATRLYRIASHAYKVPTNTADMPALCDFTFPSTHRFRSAKDGEFTALQVGVITNSKGCRLSSRLTREIVARLPPGVGDAVENVGKLREKAREYDVSPFRDEEITSHLSAEDCNNISSTPNEPVPQRPMARGMNPGIRADTALESDQEPALSRTQRRMRWTAQISEYWPLESLASLNNEDICHILSGSSSLIPRATLGFATSPSLTLPPAASQHSIALPTISSPAPPRGRIYLIGSGPGHPSLLTLAASRALQLADIVLSDKLVPEAVLRVIPNHVELRIARKFPGNADRAQDELIQAALEAVRQGRNVVRLKQGDPMLYARASSEIEHFTAHGFPPTVVPGLSSALTVPLAAGIPVTARGVAEGVTICTGVGRGGKGGRMPRYERTTTALVLMGVARLADVVQNMIANSYPDFLPVCVMERGTMPDQRIIRSTLGGIVDAMVDFRVGAQRPPGMMVVGWACLGVAQGVEGVCDDEGEGVRDRDLARVKQWLHGESFTIEEGLSETWKDL